jgi:glycosyltransferase involved in cell wall biosynthesis
LIAAAEESEELAPTISVVIPTHNRRDLFLSALHSVLRQRDADFDVVVIDDGSADGTAEAVRVFEDSRVRVLRNERPVGVAAARNMGIQAATGSWIALLDDDDLWSPDKLALQQATAAATGAQWVYGGSVEINGAGVLLGGEPPPTPEKLISYLLQQNLMPAGSSNVMFRARLFEEVGGFDIRLRLIADWDFWIRLARFGKPACTPAPLVAYRMHAGQSTVDGKGMLAEGRILAERHGTDLNAVRRWLAWSHLRRGERGRALRVYAEAVLAGNVSSLARAAIAAFHPWPTTFTRHRRSANPDWYQAAEPWLRALAEEWPH